MKTRADKQRATFGAAVLILCASACADTTLIVSPEFPSEFPNFENEGPLSGRVRSFDGAQRVTLEGVGNVFIRQGSPAELRVLAGANVHPRIVTEVRNDELVIGLNASLNMDHPTIEYHLTIPSLDEVTLVGVGRIEARSFDTGPLSLVLTGVGEIDIGALTAPRLTVMNSGIGDIKVTGSVHEQSVELFSLGGYLGGDLATNETDVRMTNLGSATVRVHDHLDARLSGSGSLHYYGDPEVVGTASGSGRIVRVGG